MSEDINYRLEPATPAVRICVEGRGRQTGSSRVAHLLSVLLWLSGYRNIELLSSQPSVQVPNLSMTPEMLSELERLPVQIVEMISFDVRSPLHVLTINRVEMEEGQDKSLGRAVKMLTKIETLFDAIKHGDEDYQKWLKEAIHAHFYGLPMPEYAAGKSKRMAGFTHTISVCRYENGFVVTQYPVINSQDVKLVNAENFAQQSIEVMEAIRYFQEQEKSEKINKIIPE
jgi:hypothetical protein